MTARTTLAALVLAACAAAPAAAHQRSASYSSWILDAEGARVDARVSQLDLSRLGLAFRDTGGPDDPVGALLASRLVLSAGGVPCAPRRAPERREAPEGWAVYSWRVACSGEGERSLASSLLLSAAPSHLHFARVTDRAGRSFERVLDAAQSGFAIAAPTPDAPAAASPGTPFAGYVRLGAEHILTGWDHLAFVLALLLLATSFGEVAALVTAFTVAHSVTLALATLGLVRPGLGPVEALIGFSIALVAAENGWILGGRDRLVPAAVVVGLVGLAVFGGGQLARGALLGLALFSGCHFALLRRAARPARLRVAVAFAFGLVHGFGFAGVLAALELPPARLAAALFGFNLGVELGQLAVVTLVWPLLRGLARLAERPARLVAEAGSAAICGLGVYWFLARHLGA